MVGQSSHHQLDTPPPDQRLAELPEIEIADPTHPLFGRRFPLLHTSTTLTGPGFAWVLYRGYMQLRVPLSVTNLSVAAPVIRTQLTREGIQELLTLAGQCGLLCPSQPDTSGAVCPTSSAEKSAPPLPRSSRR